MLSFTYNLSQEFLWKFVIINITESLASIISLRDTFPVRNPVSSILYTDRFYLTEAAAQHAQNVWPWPTALKESIVLDVPGNAVLNGFRFELEVFYTSGRCHMTYLQFVNILYTGLSKSDVEEKKIQECLAEKFQTQPKLGVLEG